MLMIISVPDFTCPAPVVHYNAITPKPTTNCRMIAMSVFSILQRILPYPTLHIFSRALVSGASVAPFSQVRSSAITFLLIAVNYPVRRQGVLLQHNCHT